MSEQAKPAASAVSAAPAKEQTFEEKHAKLITEKMNAGLTRAGAIQVIKDQIANDKAKK